MEILLGIVSSFSCGKEVKGEEVEKRMMVVWECVKRGCVLCAISCDYILFDGVYPVARAENLMRGGWGARRDKRAVFLFSPRRRFVLIRSERCKQRECDQNLIKLCFVFLLGRELI